MNLAVRTRVFVGDRAVDALPTLDRGFAYGDGLFETLRAHRGALPWWERHWRRLDRGAARLKLALPAPDRVRAQAEALLDGDDAVLKLIVSRGTGGRGYAPPGEAEPTWTLSAHPLPSGPPSSGLDLRWCDTRLSLQPALSGLKHCNRLEQVLARAEWSDPRWHDGLMRSTEGDAVEATAANLFVLRADRWLTPRLDRCGVAGICREWVMSTVAVDEARLTPDEVETADALFLCNAVRGILPVASLAGRRWSPHPAVTELRRRLAAAHPAFAAGPEVS